MTQNRTNSHEAALRIAKIQADLLVQVMGVERRCELMSEQSELWDRYFPGCPYEQIAESLEHGSALVA